MVLVIIVLAHVCGDSAIVTGSFEIVGSRQGSLRSRVDSILTAIPLFRVDVVVSRTWLKRVYQSEALVGNSLLDHLLEMSSVVRVAPGDECEASGKREHYRVDIAVNILLGKRFRLHSQVQ